MKMNRFLFALAIAGGLSALPVAAHAQPPVPAGLHDEAEPKFPMSAAEFRDRVSRRIEQARVKMEEHITEKQLPADKADEHRARFRAAIAQLNTKVDEVCADGTVTKEEAEAVHELAKSLLHHHRNPQG
ncbi:MAG: hypothetical protein ABSE49_00740 [Polyangiaceae bacterium]|jgi:hypothetical protein